MKNSTQLDKKFICLISSTLQNFAWKDRVSATCRCPICGDSAKSKSKRRGHFYVFNGKYFFKCYNCDAALPFWLFLKNEFPAVFKDYKLESVFSSSNKNTSFGVGMIEIPNRIKIKESKYKYGQFIESLNNNHSAKEYCRARKLTKKHLEIIYFTEHFENFVVEDLGIERYKNKLPNDSRLVFLMRDENNEIIGFQGRSLNERAASKYITIKVNPDSPKMFGLDKIDKNKPVIIVEGIIDSIFLPNSIAIIGGVFPSQQLEELGFVGERCYMVYDNENRHPDTLARMNKAIEAGYNVPFFKIEQKYKDINEMILGGISVQEILENIITYSERGIKAKLKLQAWRKI